MSRVSVVVLVAGFLSTVPALSASAEDRVVPFLGTPVPGSAAGEVTAAPDPASSSSVSPVESPLPEPGSFTVTIPAERTSSVSTPTTDEVAGASVVGAWVPLGSSGLAVAAAEAVRAGSDDGSDRARPSSPARSVTATVLDSDSAGRYGPSGLAIQLSRGDDADARVPVGVRVPAGVLDGRYGADYASRVRWVQVAADTIDTSSAESVPATRDADGAVMLTPKVGGSPIVLMPLSGPVSGSGTGSFAASSLKPSSSWDVSAQTGGFSWSYPLRVPPVSGGPSPKLGFAYNSQAVDGATGSTNNQTSPVGEGWELTGGGFIERTYVSCSGDDGALGAVSGSGDLCWKTDNATISFGGHSGVLVKDSASGAWKLQGDDGSRIEHLVGTAQGCQANGTYDTDCWRLTTRDGTQYWFGLNQLPGWSTGKPTTGSTWTVPVFGNDAGEPCNGASFASSSCMQGWRWNLDYVVDVHQNAQALYYTAETNSYALNGGTATSYVRGGQLDRIEYGLTASTVYGSNAATAKVAFGYDQYGRCSDASRAKCTKEPLASATTPANPASYPDTPFDQLCAGGSCSSLVSPTFWTTAMLSTVTTQVLSAGKYRSVDAWTLGHSFPDPGDGTAAALWLTQIGHTGYAADGSTVSEPLTKFEGTTLQNRVWVLTGLAPLDKYRISSITTSSGAVISVNYSDQECTPAGAAGILAAPESNTKRCFPQTWVPQITPPHAPVQDLFHKYVVTSVISDPMTGGDEDRPQETYYVYSGTPAWRYNTSSLVADKQRTWSVYAGYSSVEVRTGDVTSPSTQQVTRYTFYQGMDGDRAGAAGGSKSVSVTGAPGVADSLWFAGKVRQTTVLNGVGGAVVSDTVTTPWASGVTASDGTLNARMTGVAETVTSTPLSTGGTRTVGTKTTYEGAYGLPVTVQKATSDAGTTCTTTTTYAAANTAAWLVGFPAEVATVGTECARVATARYPDAAISDVRTTYDGGSWGGAPSKGEVTTVGTVDSYTGTTAASARWTVTARNTYDSRGRILTSTDVLGHTTTTAYTPAAGAAGAGALTGTTVTSTAPFNWTTTSTFDPAWGAVTSETDANGKLTTATYDALGRRTAVWLPGWPQAKNPTSPSTRYTYTLSQTSPNAVQTDATIAGQYVTSYVLYDGLGQQVQTQASAHGGGTVVTDTGYDAAGRTSVTNAAYWTTAVSPSTALFVPASAHQLPSQTLTSYDGAGRPTATVLVSHLKERFRTTYAYPGADRTDTTPPAGGTPTSVFTDSLGQQTKLVQYLAATVTGAATTESTTYGYDVRGNMIRMTDPAGNVWAWGFDVLGRQVTATDPDTGTTTSTYDGAGNVLTTTDARGITLAFTYDALNRKTGQYTPDTSGSLLASWTYDTLAKGQVTSSSSFTGSSPGKPGLEYKTAVTGYTDGYQSKGETVSIPTGAPAFGGTTYTTQRYYFADGAPSLSYLPAAGGLPRERLDYGYEKGRLSFVAGTNTYASVTFTGIGQVVQTERRTSALILDTVYGYDEATGAVLNIADQSQVGLTTTVQANRKYTRDNAGTITSVTTTGTGGTDTQCYTYDHLQALTAAWSPKSGKCDTAPTSATLGGPAPYWTSYTIDPATGNRTGMVQHATTAGGDDTTSTYTYPAAGGANPHGVQKVTTAVGAAAATSVSYSYDKAGNTTVRPGQSLTYTPMGKLDTVTVGADTQSRVYTADGGVLLQSDPKTGTTLYLGDTELHQDAGSSTVSAVRTYSCNGVPLAERTASTAATGTTLYWVSTDVDGSADLQIQAATGAVTHRYTDPYGNARGTPPAWSSAHGYLNMPTSSFSGLTQVGARAYDPGLGRFVTVDAILSPFLPQQNNGYSYSHNNPVTLADPSGNKPVGQYDNDWQGNTDQTGGDNSAQHIGAHGPNEYTPPAPGNDDAAPEVFTPIDYSNCNQAWSDQCTQAYALMYGANMQTWELFFQFMSGSGPSHRTFTDGNPFTEWLKYSDHIVTTRSRVAEAIRQGEKVGTYNRDLSKRPEVIFEDAFNIASGGGYGNLPQSYLGSYDLACTINSIDANGYASVTFMAENYTTLDSMTRIPGTGGQHLEPTYTEGILLNQTTGMYTTTHQTITWTETISWK